MNPSRATIPLIRPHQYDSGGGRISGVLLYTIRHNSKTLSKIQKTFEASRSKNEIQEYLKVS